MTTAISQTTLTTAEILNRVGADGRLLPVVDTMLELNELLRYAAAYDGWVRNNSNLSFKGSRTSSDSSVTERDYDEGTDYSVSSQEPYEEPTCTLGGWFKLDLTKLNDQIEPERLVQQELKNKFKVFNKTFHARVFDGDRNTYAKRIRGINYRSAYNVLSSEYVYDNSGGKGSATANKTSCYVLAFGPEKFQFSYPQFDGRMSNGSPADVGGLGFFVKDYGDIVPLLDGNSKPYPGVQSYIEHRFGQVVHHPGAIRRICNISCTSIDEVDDFSFNEDYLIDALTQMEDDLGDLNGVVIAVPTIVKAQLWKRVKEKDNVWGTNADPFGKRVMTFDNHPVITCNCIAKTQAKVV